MNSIFLILCLILIIICLSIDLGLNTDYGKYIAIGISIICLGISIYSWRKMAPIAPDVAGENEYKDIPTSELIKENIINVKSQLDNISDKNSEEYKSKLQTLKFYEDLLKKTKKSWWQRTKQKVVDAFVYSKDFEKQAKSLENTERLKKEKIIKNNPIDPNDPGYVYENFS